MAKRGSATPGEAQVDPAAGIDLLRRQIEKGRELLASWPLDYPAYQQWELLTRNFLEKAFGAGSANVDSVMDLSRIGVFPFDPPPGYWDKRHSDNLSAQVSQLEALVELLETELQLRVGGSIKPAAQAGPSRHRVFLAHGHDDGLLHEVARFMEKLEQDVIVLREQPDCGRTIIEKFEDHGDVGFAVVLLTPDDRGGTADIAFEQQQARARQNVILELGYFLGRLGRSRVCALYQEGVEIPSDYSGVLYVPLDIGGAWRLRLAQELRAAGLPVDMNKA